MRTAVDPCPRHFSAHRNPALEPLYRAQREFIREDRARPRDHERYLSAVLVSVLMPLTGIVLVVAGLDGQLSEATRAGDTGLERAQNGDATEIVKLLKECGAKE